MVHTIFWSFIPLFIPPRIRLLILVHLCFRCFLEDVSIATHLVAIWETFPCLDLVVACSLFRMTWVECFHAMLLLDSLCQFQLWLLPLQMHRRISRGRYAIFCTLNRGASLGQQRCPLPPSLPNQKYKETKIKSWTFFQPISNKSSNLYVCNSCHC